MSHGERSDLDADGVDHQRVVLVVADGIAVPGRRDLRGMIRVHAHVAHFGALAVDHQNAVRPLEDLHQEIPEDVRHAARPTLIARRRIAVAGQRHLTVLLHDVGRPALQDRIGEVADELLEVSDAVGPSRSVEHRARTRCRRLEAGEIGMRPDAREIRRGATRRAAGRRHGIRRRSLPPGRRRNHGNHCDRQK
jgi:hypothetical protein